MSLISTLNGHTQNVTCVHFSPNGQKIASGSMDMTIKIWNAESHDYECLNTLNEHTGRVSSVAWSPLGHKIASSSSDPTIKIWDSETYECLHILNGHTN